MQVSVRLLLLLSYIYFSEAHSEPSQTSKLKLFVKIVHSRKPLTNFAKRSIIDVRLGYKFTSEWMFSLVGLQLLSQVD